MAGLDWPIPDFSTLSRRQKTIAVQLSSRRAPGPLNLLVDSTGIKFLGDGEWLARKHGTVVQLFQAGAVLGFLATEAVDRASRLQDTLDPSADPVSVRNTDHGRVFDFGLSVLPGFVISERVHAAQLAQVPEEPILE